MIVPYRGPHYVSLRLGPVSMALFDNVTAYEMILTMALPRHIVQLSLWTVGPILPHARLITRPR